MSLFKTNRKILQVSKTGKAKSHINRKSISSTDSGEGDIKTVISRNKKNTKIFNIIT
jgi:hypothetical protein